MLCACYATHHGAAALRVAVQQAQSAQSFLVPQPVLRRVQHTVAAQHLQHTDKPCSGTAAALKSHGAHDSATHCLSHTFTFICQSLGFLPLWLSGSIDLSPGPLFQDKCPRHSINNLSANQTRQSIYNSYCILPGETFLMKAKVIDLPLSMIDKGLCPSD